MFHVGRLGEGGLVLEFPSGSDGALLSFKEQIGAAQLAGVEEVLLSYETLTIFYNPLVRRYEELVQALERLPVSFSTDYASDEMGAEHHIPVCYDPVLAPDLRELAGCCALSVEEVVSLHVAGRYSVVGMGFSPGFGFLSGLPTVLACPRRRSPRVKVPAGAVGIAAHQTGIYPSETSGGWNLIGQTPMSLVDYTQEAPTRLRTGDWVHFHPITLREFHAYGRG